MLDNKEEKKSTGRSLIGWLLYLLVIIGLAYLIVTFVGQRTKVSGPSMQNTLHNGDNLIVDKLSYRFHDPERYDIIVFHHGTGVFLYVFGISCTNALTYQYRRSCHDGETERHGGPHR